MGKNYVLIDQGKAFFKHWIKVFIPSTLIFVLGLIINTKYTNGSFIDKDSLSKLPIFLQNNLTGTIIIASLISFIVGVVGASLYDPQIYKAKLLKLLMFIAIPTNIICFFTGVIPFAITYTIAAFVAIILIGLGEVFLMKQFIR